MIIYIKKPTPGKTKELFLANARNERKKKLNEFRYTKLTIYNKFHLDSCR